MLDLVRLPRSSALRYPHEFSGGQRQRIGIARALALRPSLHRVRRGRLRHSTSRCRRRSSTCCRICRRELDLTYLFISHDLSVVRHISEPHSGDVSRPHRRDRDGGRPVQQPRASLHAGHSCRPSRLLTPTNLAIGTDLTGDLPSASAVPRGCRFAARCRHAVGSLPWTIRRSRPSTAGHLVACHRAADGSSSAHSPLIGELAMQRVLIVECMQEISSFNPVPSGYENFHIERGEEMLAQRGLNTAIGGALPVFEARRTSTVVPAIRRARGQRRACCRPTGWARLSARDPARRSSERVDRGRRRLLLAARRDGRRGRARSRRLSAAARRGASSARGRRSSSRSTCTASSPTACCGRSTGSRSTTPIRTSISPTPARRAAAAAAAAPRRRGRSPSSRASSIPALVRGDELITKTGCYGDLIREAQRIERDGTALAAGIMIGNPVHRRAGTVQPGPRRDRRRRRDSGRARPMRLAEEFWPLRLRMQGKLISLERAIAQAQTIEGPVVFTDAADATSSGATGDSNIIIEGAARGRLSQARAGADRRPEPRPRLRTRPASARRSRSTLGGALDTRALHADAGDGAACKLAVGRARAAGDHEDRPRRRADGGADIRQFHRRRLQPHAQPVRPGDVLRQRPRPARFRPDRREVAAHRVPHVRCLGGEELQHRRAGRDLGQPADARPHDLRAADLSARRGRHLRGEPRNLQSEAGRSPPPARGRAERRSLRSVSQREPRA